MKLLLTLAALSACHSLSVAEDMKESRFIDENALKTLLELTRQTQSTTAAAPLKLQYPYLAQKEKLTLQGERQTRYPLQSLNVDFALLPQTFVTTQQQQQQQQQQPQQPQLSRPATSAHEKLVDVKPIYLPYPLKGQPVYTRATFQALADLQATLGEDQKPPYMSSYPIGIPPAVEHTKIPAHFATTYAALEAYNPTTKPQSINAPVEHRQPAYLTFPNLFAHANQHQAGIQLSYHQQAQPYQRYPLSAPSNAPSFIIINPKNYPSYHYYTASNYTFPRGGTAPYDGALENVESGEFTPDYVNDLSLNKEQPGTQTSGDDSSSATEVEPLYHHLPHALTNDGGIFTQALLEQSRQPENSHNLLELWKRQQLKRHLQDQVAAFYFRNLNLNKK